MCAMTRSVNPLKACRFHVKHERTFACRVFHVNHRRALTCRRFHETLPVLAMRSKRAKRLPREDGARFFVTGACRMKKAYVKPTLVRRALLAAIAANGNGFVTSPGADPT